MADAEYDSPLHRRLRRQAIANYRPGVTPCFLCGKPMSDEPSKLHLAHQFPRGHPERVTGPRGLAHEACNVSGKYNHRAESPPCMPSSLLRETFPEHYRRQVEEYSDWLLMTREGQQWLKQNPHHKKYIQSSSSPNGKH